VVEIIQLLIYPHKRGKVMYTVITLLFGKLDGNIRSENEWLWVSVLMAFIVPVV
jgi:hypothetical protein